MKDLEYIKLIKNFKKELHRRYGKKLCKELHASCKDCKIRILIAELNEEIDLNL